MRVSAAPRPISRLRGLLALLAVIVGLLLAPATPQALAAAGEAHEGPALGEAAPSSVQTLRSLWVKTVVFVRQKQRELHRELVAAIKTLRREGPAAAWPLIVLSFLYGVFHAAGPGHGKAVISTYLLTHRSALRRGIWLSTFASLTQGLTAILLVLLLVGLVGWTRADTHAAVGTLETVSFALIALLGLGLAGRALWAFWRGAIRPGATRSAVAGGLPHSHSGGTACCGHSHTPDPAHLAQPLSIKTFAAVVLSIGIRPCSGAVLVLLFAEVLDLRWAGIAAVLAMSLGTAMTVSALAFLAVNARHLASLATGDGRYFALAGQAVAMLGGIIITALGASLFLGSLGPSHPLF